MKRIRTMMFWFFACALACRGGGIDWPKVSVRLPELKTPQISSERLSGALTLPEWRLRLPNNGELWRVGGISVWTWEARPPVDGLIDLFGNADDFITARFADRIELVTLKKNNADAIGRSEYVEQDAKELSAGDADLLRYLLTCDGSYKWKEDCAPYLGLCDYRLRVKFFRQRQVVIVDLSFSEGYPIARVVKEGRAVAEKSFEFGSDGIVAAIERVFPGEIP